MSTSLTTAIIKRTLRVPANVVPSSNMLSERGQAISRQLDVALINVGFKASKELLEYMSSINGSDALELSKSVIDALKKLKGDHVRHNPYFIDFPFNVPDTIEFWTGLLEQTYGGDYAELWDGNLLALDGYGKVQHTYEVMLARHEPFVDVLGKSLKVVHLGGTLHEEVVRLYTSLASSKVVSTGDDKVLLEKLAEAVLDEPLDITIPVRENRAIINAVRARNGSFIYVDTVTDVLRLAVFLSDGDVSLQEKTKFVSFSNKIRRSLLEGLDHVISDNPGKLGDVYKHREMFKRLDERLHSGNTKNFNAKRVFEVARSGENLSFEAKLEKAFAGKDTKTTLNLFEKSPGLFVKSFNRLLLQSSLSDISDIVAMLEKVLPKVATPTAIGLRQYLGNRRERKTNRLFINKRGTGKVVADEQPVLGSFIVDPILAVIDKEIASRLEDGDYIVDRNILNVALPLSNRQAGSGLGVLPRGSTDNFSAELVRFFIYWKQKSMRTDYDLSAIMLNENFNSVGQLSYTNLRLGGGTHSGDITSAPKGASEFIDVILNKVNAKYVVPQINVYSGEGFDEVKESFFGYMERDPSDNGKPFEAKTVKTKSELRGKNKVALPLVFIKEDDGTISVKWVHAFIQGMSWGNATENNTLSTSTLIRSIVENDYLTVKYLVDLIANKEGSTVTYTEDIDGYKDDVDYSNHKFIGLDVPEGLPTDIGTVIDLTNLHELL